MAGIACPLNFSIKKPTNGGMIKDKSAVSGPEIRYAFRQAVGRGNVEVSDGGGHQAPGSANRLRPPPFAPLIGWRAISILVDV